MAKGHCQTRNNLSEVPGDLLISFVVGEGGFLHPVKANDTTGSSGGAAARGGASNTAESRKQEAFESGNPRDAYSSVSHLKGNLDSLSFAIGLREEGGQEGALERLLPMLKIQPRPAGDVSA